MINLAIIQHLLDTALKLAVPVESMRLAMGGSINESYLITLTDARVIFVKSHRRQSIPGMYAAEFKALQLLSHPKALLVPNPLYQNEDFLVMDAFQQGPAASDWQEQMGRGLASLHHATRQRQCGFDMDTYLGTFKQTNLWQDDWIGFWRDQRLTAQFALLMEHLSVHDPLLKAADKLMARLDDLLACDPEPAVLLHGDLWSGNAASNAKGEPVIFDPASYYGQREAEFGMMRLFGGFGPACEAAYREEWPFQPGYERRIEVYKLYHQLNHLNLFGHAYYNASLHTIQGLI
ncbi:MAG: protein-ribulosamine 3-kinase [Pseudohongiellaceae bacterium]|jgi:protein-ribulosamine 3-kinase